MIFFLVCVLTMGYLQKQGNNVGNTFNIDENYHIKITETSENNIKIVKNYKINDSGKFIEIEK